MVDNLVIILESSTDTFSGVAVVTENKASTAEAIGGLIQLGSVGSDPASGDPWPIYSTNMPDTPDNCMTVFTTEGVRQGRYMITGAYHYRSGFQVLVRSSTYTPGLDKIKEVIEYLETVYQEPVTILSDTYTVHSVSITSGPLPLGKSVEDSKRYLFSMNGTLTYQEQL